MGRATKFPIPAYHYALLRINYSFLKASTVTYSYIEYTKANIILLRLNYFRSFTLREWVNTLFSSNLQYVQKISMARYWHWPYSRDRYIIHLILNIHMCKFLWESKPPAHPLLTVSAKNVMCAFLFICKVWGQICLFGYTIISF